MVANDAVVELRDSIGHQHRNKLEKKKNVHRQQQNIDNDDNRNKDTLDDDSITIDKLSTGENTAEILTRNPEIIHDNNLIVSSTSIAASTLNLSIKTNLVNINNDHNNDDNYSEMNLNNLNNSYPYRNYINRNNSSNHNNVRKRRHSHYGYRYRCIKMKNHFHCFHCLNELKKIKQLIIDCNNNNNNINGYNHVNRDNYNNDDDDHQYKTQTIDEYYSTGSNTIIEPSFVMRYLCYLAYFVLILFGYFRMILEWANIGNYNVIKELNREGYHPLYNSWQAFFTRYIYRRIADIFSIPITGNPGGVVTVLERESNDRNFTFELTGKQQQCINLASYDYLGFSKSSSNDPSIEQTIRKYGVSVNAIHEIGKLDLLQELETKFAKFLRVESCAIFGMGFATNSTNIPSLADEQCLILADKHSHASAKSGIFLSGATFKYFKHNDCNDLERIICRSILDGQPNGKPWRKIIIIVEGVYSMEGTIVDLPKLIQLKRKYRCYLYVDEAHSIGALGPNGRGVVDYFDCNPDDIDLLMGTMTKSFAAAGGYLAGRRQLIDHIRQYSLSNYAGSISPPIIQQIMNTLSILTNHEQYNYEGKRRIQQLLSNTHYMRDHLKRLGFIIAGHYDSPVIPIMVYMPGTLGSIVRMAIRNGLALVSAGYPATSLTTNRIRLCMTAQHSHKTLDHVIRILNKIGDVHHIKYQHYGVL